jgi:hypothetical protein
MAANIVPLIFFVFVIALGLAVCVFWIVQLVDAITREFYDPNMKIVWVLVILFLHVIGAIVYACIGRQQGTLRRR